MHTSQLGHKLELRTYGAAWLAGTTRYTMHCRLQGECCTMLPLALLLHLLLTWGWLIATCVRGI